MIEAHTIGYCVGTSSLLAGINFRAEAGKVSAIIGANGSGKTTLLRLLAGLSVPTAGHVSIAGVPAQRFSPAELAKRRAVVTQTLDAGIQFSVADFIAFGGYVYQTSVSASKLKSVLNDVIADYDLDGFRHRELATLSGGEQQRAAMAKAVYQLRLSDEPERFILLDEPANHLDLRYQQALVRQIIQLKNEGYGVVVILHDLAQVHQIADDVLCLKEGRRFASGEAEKIITPELLEGCFHLSRFDIENNPHWLGKQPLAQHLHAYGT